MKKVWFSTLGLCLGAALGVSAQDAVAPRIAVIDFQRVMAESIIGKEFLKKGKELQSQLQTEGQKKQSELDKLTAELTALQQDLQKQAPVLSEEALETKQQELRRKEREGQALAQDYEQDMKRKEEKLGRELQRLQAEVEGKLRPHIEAASKERKVDVLLFSQAVAYRNEAVDISRDVIQRVDVANPAAAAAPAAAKPAAAAKP